MNNIMRQRQKLFQIENRTTGIFRSFRLASILGASVVLISLMNLFRSTVSHNGGVPLHRAPSSINRAVLVLVKPSSLFGPTGAALSPELIDTYRKIKASETHFDASQVIPEGMTPTEDAGLVFSKIADRSFSSFFNSAQMRSTPLGKTATTVEKKMKQDVTVESDGVKHKMTFQYQAFQGLAKIDYSGLANASLKYQARESILNFEVYEKLSKSKELVLGQMSSPADRVSSVNVRWNF